jgi:hypothetical protein
MTPHWLGFAAGVQTGGALAADPYTTLDVKKDATQDDIQKPIAARRKGCIRT